MHTYNRPLEAPAELLSTLVEIVPLPLAFIDRSFRFAYANEAAARQLGMRRDHVEGMEVSEALPEFWPVLHSMLDRVLAGETIVNQEVDLRELSDERREWMGSFYPVQEDGEIIAVACTSVDVTELRATQRALQVRNDLFAMLAGVNAAVSRSASKEELFSEICEIAFKTGNFRYAWVGEPHDKTLTGVASSGNNAEYMRNLQSAGRVVVIDPDDPRSHGPISQAYLRGEVSVVNDYFESPVTEVWRDVATEVGFFGSAAIPIRQKGRVVAVLTLYAEQKDFFTDELVETLAEITPSLTLAMDRFALDREREVAKAKLMLRDRALSAATQGVVITDARAGDNPIIFATPALEELTGYTQEEFLGMNGRMLQGKDTDPAAVREIGEAVKAGRPCELEILNYRKDGETFWNRMAISPIFDDDSKLSHFICVMTDVTERRMLEEQMQQAQKMEAVGQLAGGVAHDFNNALTAIRGSVDLALAEVGPGSARDDLHRIDKAAELAARLTRQLLAFSSQQVLKPQSSDLNQILTDTTALIGPLIGDNVELTERLAPDLESVLVDRAQLQQVVMNLVINARDAMPDGGRIAIETSAFVVDELPVANRFALKAGQYALIAIADTGVGMDHVTLSKVFDPFFTTKRDGTGLGLATVYGIVNQSGGHIDVESQPGVGTRFKIYLPTTTRAISPDRHAPTSGTDSLDGTETILHVEDSEMLRPLLVRTLGARGYTVLSASNAEEAIQIAKEQAGKIDLMITDIVMPGLNGRELAEVLLADTPDLRVLFTSGYPADMVIRQGIAEAEVNFIEKPFLTRDLLPQIRSILDADPGTGEQNYM